MKLRAICVKPRPLTLDDLWPTFQGHGSTPFVITYHLSTISIYDLGWPWMTLNLTSNFFGVKTFFGWKISFGTLKFFWVLTLNDLQKQKLSRKKIPMKNIFGTLKIFRWCDIFFLGHDILLKIKFWKKKILRGEIFFGGRGAKPPAPCVVIPGTAKPYGSVTMSISLKTKRFRAPCMLWNKSGLGGQNTPETPKIL